MKKINNVLAVFLNIRIFLIFNLLILILKISYSFIVGFPGETFEDYRIAQNIARHGIYAEYLAVGSTAYKLPVYPLFLSFFIKFFPDFHKEAIIVAQHFIFFLIPILIITITKIFNQEKSGIFAAYFFIFSPAYIFYSGVLEVTNVFIPIFLLWIFAFLKIYKNPKIGNYYWVLGILTALVLLTQVVVAPLIFILIISLVFLKKISMPKTMLVFAIAAIFYSAWIVRNYAVFDKVILTKTPFWQNVFLGYTPQVNVLKDVMLISDNKEQEVSGLRRTVNEFEMEKKYRNETVKVLKGNNDKIFIKAFQNVALLWYVPSKYFYDSSPQILFGRKFFVLIVNILTIFALLHFYRKQKLLFAVSVLLFINFTVPYMIGHAANTRFKLDFEWYQYLIVAIFLTDKYFRTNPEISAAQSLKNLES